MINIAVAGAAGRMGRTLIEACARAEGLRLSAAIERSGRSFSDKLASELIDAANETGAAIRKRDETHKMAEANRAFSHYRL